MRKNKTLWIIIGIIILAIVAIGISRFWPQIMAKLSPSSTTPTVLTNANGMNEGAAPWPVELSRLKARLTADGLPALSEEGSALHIHQHLDIFLDGVPVPVPSGIGINDSAIPSQSFISPIHVHDLSGVIHVESPTVQDFTLGQFFDVWGVAFTATRIGGYYNTGGKTLRVYVNGQPYQGDPRNLVLAAHQEIAIVYGTEQEIPKVIPSSYVFPEGY